MVVLFSREGTSLLFHFVPRFTQVKLLVLQQTFPEYDKCKFILLLYGAQFQYSSSSLFIFIYIALCHWRRFYAWKELSKSTQAGGGAGGQPPAQKILENRGNSGKHQENSRTFRAHLSENTLKSGCFITILNKNSGKLSTAPSAPESISPVLLCKSKSHKTSIIKTCY